MFLRAPEIGFGPAAQWAALCDAIEAQARHEITSLWHGARALSACPTFGAGSPAGQDLSAIAQAAEYLLAVLGQAAAFSADALRPEPVDLAALVAVLRAGVGRGPAALGSAALRLPVGVNLLVEVAPDLPAVHADPLQLRRVLENLLANALAHTRHGAVRIRIHSEDPDQVLIHVADTGCGLSAERRRELLAAATAPRGPGPSAALGLSLCHRIIAAHGGALEVQSEGGVGSCFTVRLFRQGPRATSTLAVPSGEDSTVGSQRIMARSGSTEERIWAVAEKSHDLRSPLCGIIALTELLWQSADRLRPDQQEDLAQMRAGARSVLRLVDKLLESTRLVSGSLELANDVICAREFLEQAARALRQRMGPAALVTLDVQPPDLCWIGDSDRLQDAVVELAWDGLCAAKTPSLRLSAVLASSWGPRQANEPFSPEVCVELQPEKSLHNGCRAARDLGHPAPRSRRSTGQTVCVDANDQARALSLFLARGYVVRHGGYVQQMALRGGPPACLIVLPRNGPRMASVL